MSRSRICAKCKPATPLNPRKVPPGAAGAVDVDVCANCRGVWLDWGELGDLKELKQLIPSMTGSTAWQRDLETGHCPACEKHPKMLRLPVGAFGVDRCPDCLGLWFDGGELGPMLTDQGFELLLKTLRDHPV
jgi:Zn-finger nucleic acid-binding protein